MDDVPATLWTALMSATGQQFHLERVLPSVADRPQLREATELASRHLGAACEALQAARKIAEE
jgi:hypothetical protein